tara:strand:+ start:126 stop:359 length:234 start_codon:yes stop_codon:yes gene_type:complete
MDWLDNIKGWARSITDLGIVAIALVVVLQILFGGAGVPFFSGIDVVSNITGMVNSLGSQGLVGLVAVLVLYWAFTKD